MAGENKWTKRRLAEICRSIDYGYTASASSEPVGPRFLRITDIVGGHIDWDSVPFCEIDAESRSRFELDDGDIVIARTGASTGTSAFITDAPDAVFASYLVRLKIAPPNDPRFVSYSLKGPMFWSYIRGVLGDKSAQPNASARTMTQAPVLLPPPSEQRAIAAVLGALDDKIELNRRMCRTLEGIARAIFQAWFVDFEPVRAKAAGAKRFRGMPQAVFDTLPTQFVDSPLGPIPKGWKCGPLPDFIDVNPPRALRKGEVAPYLDMANMPTRTHAPETWIQRPAGSGMRFINGDTLVARITPCLENGKTAYVDFLAEGQVGWGSTEYIVLRPKPPLPAVFAYCLARGDEFRSYAIQRMTGSSGRQRVPHESLQYFVLAVPSEPVAKMFGNLADPLFIRSRICMEQSRSLGALRDALLPKLVSGELRIRDVERIIGRCA